MSAFWTIALGLLGWLLAAIIAGPLVGMSLAAMRHGRAPAAPKSLPQER